MHRLATPFSVSLTAAALVLLAPARPAAAQEPAPAAVPSPTPTAAPAAAPAARHDFGLDDLAALRQVSDPHVSPDGLWVAYVVASADLEADKRSGDIWMTRWDGSDSIALTHTKEDESRPRFSPDGRHLAFLAERGGEDAKAQVYLLRREGGEARALTSLPGGVSDYAWSPDGKRIVAVAEDPDPDEPKTEADKKKTRPPIVIDRYQFKQDEEGYLRRLYSHLYLVDAATGKAEALTAGAFDDALPSWSPDGTQIAFSSKRAGDPDRHENWDVYVVEARPGATARQLTTFDGADADPSAGTPPAFSPDGKTIAYVQGVSPKWAIYDMPQLAVIPVAGGEARLLTPELDRPVGDVSWSADGRTIAFLFEDDRSRVVGRVPARGGSVERLTPPGLVVRDLSLGPQGRLVATVTRPEQPAEVAAIEAGGPRLLSAHNRELAQGVRFATVEGLSYASKDGAEIHALLVKPPGFEPGRRYPLIALIHGGPTDQDGFEFDPMWQTLAGHGYLVVAPNYRGSSGRGHAFSRAIFADWGHLEVEDVLGAVDKLVAAGLADPERLGIGGWSYGGMTTNYTIASDPRFKAAASGAGVSNMFASYGTDQYIRQYEVELGLPWLRPEAYAKVSFPFLHADRIKTPTLFLCGEKDFNVPLLNSEQMYQALRSQDVPTQLVIYPGQPHGLKKLSYQRDRLARYLAWFDRYLLGVGSGVPPKP